MGNITLSNKICQDARKSPSSSSPGRAPCGGSGEAPEGGPSLPCLYSNISTEIVPENLRKEQILALCGILAPYQKRQAHTLFSNVEKLIGYAPSVGHVGFFTLTTKDTTDKKEFSRRWNSMNTHYWSQSPHFGHWIGCFEQQKRGAWHLHILAVLHYDIRTGVDFEAFEQGRYSSASPYLRSVWRDLRGACLRYGFGRHELLPVKSNAEGMARYIGKYVSKHIGQREEAAKGKRLTTGSQGWCKNSVRFAWNTDGSKEWRRKVKTFAACLGINGEAGLYFKLGPNWAYRHADAIYNVDDLVQSLGREIAVLHGESLVNAKTGEIIF